MNVKITSIDVGRTFKRYTLENVNFIKAILLTFFAFALEVLERKFWLY